MSFSSSPFHLFTPQVSTGRVVTALGLLGMLGGFFSALLACFIGTWADAPGKRRGGKRRD